eukprot:CAMPEP_0184868276 /NCGR_PEP_ID=MMETSP0580-20130426/29814_1 /TAXON_ID=1118495 /ORGANISM="Dactyliosolen fragilissimus" /LENGTH=617 /DNA_ID=CAMNT_0027369061 /DNA_START=488 /DNA_END=2341 /DNA_ORIENTATION=-
MHRFKILVLSLLCVDTIAHVLPQHVSSSDCTVNFSFVHKARPRFVQKNFAMFSIKCGVFEGSKVKNDNHDNEELKKNQILNESVNDTVENTTDQTGSFELGTKGTVGNDSISTLVLSTNTVSKAIKTDEISRDKNDSKEFSINSSKSNEDNLILEGVEESGNASNFQEKENSRYKEQIAMAIELSRKVTINKTGMQKKQLSGRRTQTSVGPFRSRDSARKKFNKNSPGQILRSVRHIAAAQILKTDFDSHLDKTEQNKTLDNDITNSTVNKEVEELSNNSNSVSYVNSIKSTIDTLIQKQNSQRNPKSMSASFGLFGEPIDNNEKHDEIEQNKRRYQVREGHAANNPDPGTVLVKSAMSSISSSLPSKTSAIRDHLSVRMALQSDDITIANLRLSVFSDFTPELRRKFCKRSCQVLNDRRLKGAVCLVAVVEKSKDSDLGNRMAYTSMDRKSTSGNIKKDDELELVLGSLECSTHEFDGTELGRQRPKGSLLYITEVAVSPKARRCGAGTMLLKGVDELAAFRNVESIYLHVDVTNHIACKMYENGGYKILDKSVPIYKEFTTSLNLHDGATKGRIHHLLYKDVSIDSTWLDIEQKSPEHTSKGKSEKGSLGFELPN